MLPTGVEYREIVGERRLATRGEPVYGEPTNDGWRAWDVTRSKVGALLDADIDLGVTHDETILYLGAASGTTVSHLADFSGPVYAVEFSARPMLDLVRVATSRPNIIPLFKDARTPTSYTHVVESNVDVIVQDVATRGQATVALANRRFLDPENGRLILMLKTRSEDTTRSPESVFNTVQTELEPEYDLLESYRMDDYHADHYGIVAIPSDE